MTAKKKDPFHKVQFLGDSCFNRKDRLQDAPFFAFVISLIFISGYN